MHYFAHVLTHPGDDVFNNKWPTTNHHINWWDDHSYTTGALHFVDHFMMCVCLVLFWIIKPRSGTILYTTTECPEFIRNKATRAVQLIIVTNNYYNVVHLQLCMRSPYIWPICASTRSNTCARLSVEFACPQTHMAYTRILCTVDLWSTVHNTHTHTL